MYRQLHLQYHSTYHYILQHQCCPGYLPTVNRYLHIAPGGDDAIHGAPVVASCCRPSRGAASRKGDAEKRNCRGARHGPIDDWWRFPKIWVPSGKLT